MSNFGERILHNEVHHAIDARRTTGAFKNESQPHGGEGLRWQIAEHRNGCSAVEKPSEVEQLRLRDAPWRSANQLSGPISFLQLASAESESWASGKQKPKVTPETPGLLNRKFEHRLDRSS